MCKAGDVYENPVTGERVVIRVGKEESGGELVITDLYVSPGGAVAGEHIHPDIEETFTMVRGRVGFRLDGREEIARLGERLHAPAGMAHDWWNAGDNEAHVVVELRADASRLERFEMMISMLYGMARDGKTDAKGRPNLLQAALFAQEFDDVIRFVKPPRFLQKVLFGALAPVARLLLIPAEIAKHSGRIGSWTTHFQSRLPTGAKAVDSGLGNSNERAGSSRR